MEGSHNHTEKGQQLTMLVNHVSVRPGVRPPGSRWPGSAIWPKSVGKQMPQGIPSHFLVYAQESGQTKLTFEECFVFGLSFLAGDLCLRKFCLYKSFRWWFCEKKLPPNGLLLCKNGMFFPSKSPLLVGVSLGRLAARARSCCMAMGWELVCFVKGFSLQSCTRKTVTADL